MQKLDDVNAGQALATLHAYNRAVRTDIAFNPNVKDGRRTEGLAVPKSNWANTLDTTPYEAYAVTCGITFTFGGLRVSTACEVLDTAETPISGLFACGELVGGLYGVCVDGVCSGATVLRDWDPDPTYVHVLGYASDTLTVDVLHDLGTLSIEKTSDKSAYAHGETITYSYAVTYVAGADMSPAQNIVVTDTDEYGSLTVSAVTHLVKGLVTRPMAIGLSRRTLDVLREGLAFAVKVARTAEPGGPLRRRPRAAWGRGRGRPATGRRSSRSGRRRSSPCRRG